MWEMAIYSKDKQIVRDSDFKFALTKYLKI